MIRRIKDDKVYIGGVGPARTSEPLEAGAEKVAIQIEYSAGDIPRAITLLLSPQQIPGSSFFQDCTRITTSPRHLGQKLMHRGPHAFLISSTTSP